MKLSEMKQILEVGGLRLTKSLGQNFLHDGNQLRRIVAAAELQPLDKVLEIGPGLGPLTETLVKQASHVLAIEKDRRLFELLQQRFADQRNLTLLHDDALEYLKREPRDWSGWKLVANLPYSVASRILVELARSPRPPARIVTTVQIEVAHRIMTQPASADYGIMTLLMQLHYTPAGWFKIPAGCFHPPPEVDSACITLLCRPEPLLTPTQTEVFERIVKCAFSQRRKMMLKLLKGVWPEPRLASAMNEVHLPPNVRAEAVSLQQFADLACLLTQ